MLLKTSNHTLWFKTMYYVAIPKNGTSNLSCVLFTLLRQRRWCLVSVNCGLSSHKFNQKEQHSDGSGVAPFKSAVCLNLCHVYQVVHGLPWIRQCSSDALSMRHIIQISH